MANRWIWAAQWATRILFLAASWLLGWFIGHAWTKAYEMHVMTGESRPFTPWSAVFQLSWDFLKCFYLFVPLLLIGFACLRLLSSELGDSKQMRRSDAFYTLGAFALMLLGLLYKGLRSPSVQW